MEELGRRRRRPAKACTACRRRKMRCDQARPCNNCAQSTRYECIYPREGLRVAQATHTAPVRRLQPGPTLAPFLASRNPPTHLSSAVQQTRAQLSQSQITLPTPSHSSNAATTAATTPDVAALLSRISELESRVSNISQPLQADHTGPGHTDITTTQRSALPDENSTTERRFANQSSWINLTTLHTKILRCLSRAQEENENMRPVVSHGKAMIMQIATRLTTAEEDYTTVSSSDMPDKSVVDDLVSSYIDHFENLFRVLHLPSFIAEYEAYWQDPNGARELFLAQLQVCMVLGVLTSDNPLQYGSAPAKWLRRARNWVDCSSGGPRKRLLKFEEVQLQCLLCLAESNGVASEQQAWLDAGDLLRKAMAVCLHQDPADLGIQDRKEAGKRRRLWATILELNTLLSLQVARPPLISPGDWTTLPPDAMEETEDLTSINNSVLGSYDRRSMPTQPSVQRAFFNSFDIRLGIASKMHTTAPKMAYDHRLKLHHNLWRYRKRLVDTISDISGNEFERDDAGPAGVVLAEVIFYRYTLAVHLPLLGRHIKEHEFHFSRRLCTSVAHNMVRRCGIGPSPTGSSEQDMARSLEPRFIFLNSPGLFRGLIMQAIFSILLELVTYAEEQADDDGGGLPESDHETVQLASEACMEWILSRATQGSHDLPSACFTAGCLAYSQAIMLRSSSDEVDAAMIETSTQACQKYNDGLTHALQLLESSEAPISPVSTERVGLVPPFEGDWQNDFALGADLESFMSHDWFMN